MTMFVAICYLKINLMMMTKFMSFTSLRALIRPIRSDAPTFNTKI